MQYQKVIEQLGYSRKEAKVYLASLKLGESHVSDIATKVQMPRSTVQAIIDRLHQDGLMEFYVMRRYKYWVATNPTLLLENLQRKEHLVEGVIPALVEMRRCARKRYDKQKHAEPITHINTCASSAVQPMLVANDQGIIQFVNKAWEDLFGYSLSEIQGKDAHSLTSVETPDEVYRELWRSVLNRKLFQTDKIIDIKKDGSTFQAKTTIFTIEHVGSIYFVQVFEQC